MDNLKYQIIQSLSTEMCPDEPYFSKCNGSSEDTLLENTMLKVKYLPRYPGHKKFAIVLTHDVDLIKPSWKYYAYHLIKRPKTGMILMIKRQNPYDTFQKIMEIEKKIKTKSTFFFMAINRDPTGIRYNIENLKETIDIILDEGFEVGLHGSYNSYRDLNQLRREKLRLEKTAGEPIIGYRNHYLRFKIPDTWELLERVGFKYDSTLGYNDMIGFRARIPYPFNGIDIKSGREYNILEISLNVMDGTLFEYMGLSLSKAFEVVKQLMDIVEKYHGVLTLNWHNDKFDGLYWRHYEDLYIKILKEAKRRGAWLTNCEELVRWWEQNGVI